MNSEQSIVINDLLSFISCKIKCTPRDKLLHSLRNYYSEKVILHAQKTLLESLPVKKSTRHGRNVKHPDPLVAMYDCFQLIPSEDLPVFVCRNLNNVPHLEALKEVIKCELLDTDDCDNDEEILNPHQDIKDEQIVMKSQIADITDVVKQIKDQLKHIVEQQPSPSSPAKQSKAISFSKTGTKRKKIFISNNNKISSKTIMSIPNEPKKSPKKTMAYIQKLIDEDEEMKNETQDEERDEEDSDYYDEIISDEERVVVQNACEVVLKEGLEDVFDHSILTTRGSPLKIPGEKIIYIKNEEEDFSFDSFDMDEENSIEISSADHYVNFDMDSSSRIDGAEPAIIVSHCSTENFENDLFFTCTGCNLSSRNKLTFNGHRCSTATSGRKHKNSRLGFVCSVCEFETEDVTQFNEHMLGHYDMIPEEGFECILCIFKSNRYDEYRAHLDSHSWKRPYRCDSCSYKCSKEIRYKNHLIRHLECKGPNHFECIICGKICGTRNTMEKHKQMHKRNFDFRCEYCGITFRHKSALSQHILLSHTKERTFVCSICNCLYDSQHSLDIHMKVHFKDNFFTCHVCNEKIKSKTTFRNHILTQHADVKAFKCEHCGESFTFKHTLLMHRKRHEHQLFACQYCNKKFKCASYLKIHCAIHEGKKPYKCTHCDFESTAKTELKKHLSIHDEPYVLSCASCNFLTTELTDLEKHNQEKHNLIHESLHISKDSFVDQVMVVMAE